MRGARTRLWAHLAQLSPLLVQERLTGLLRACRLIDANPGLCGVVPASLDDAICDASLSVSNLCSDDDTPTLAPCPPPAPPVPPAAPPPPPTAPPPAAPVDASSSGAPVGAIAGGVTGGVGEPRQPCSLAACPPVAASQRSWMASLCGLPDRPYSWLTPPAVALAVLAFLAFRPGKGWLRRKAAGGGASAADALESGGKGAPPGAPLGSPPAAPNALLPSASSKQNAPGVPGSVPTEPAVDTFIQAKAYTPEPAFGAALQPPPPAASLSSGATGSRGPPTPPAGSAAVASLPGSTASATSATISHGQRSAYSQPMGGRFARRAAKLPACRPSLHCLLRMPQARHLRCCFLAPLPMPAPRNASIPQPTRRLQRWLPGRGRLAEHHRQPPVGAPARRAAAAAAGA